MLVFYGGDLLASRPNSQAGASSLVGCPRLLIQYIHSYSSYLEAVSSIDNLRTRHAVVTKNPLYMDPIHYSTTRNDKVILC
jgi:hypothetical protein